MIKEEKIIRKICEKNKKNKNKYISKRIMKEKIKNSQSFFNIENISEDGILHLKSKEFARILSVQAVDLSLSSTTQRQFFFQQLRYLFQIQNLDLRIYKLDEKMDLNANKDYYIKLMNQFESNTQRLDFLKSQYARLEILEDEKLTVTSNYYFVIISSNEKMLEHQIEELENYCYNMNPQIFTKKLVDKLEVYSFLVNLYGVNTNLEQLLFYDLPELITPFYIREYRNYLKFEDREIQLISIKNLPLFIAELYFEDLFNVPNVKSCIHIKDTMDIQSVVKRLDSNYEMLTSERIMTRKLSDATQMDAEKENFKELMNQIQNGDEKLKEVDFIILVEGNQNIREEKIKELKKIADIFQIKLEVPQMRQYGLWQAFDITTKNLDDYKMYLPTLTLSASFPLTITHFNDESGYLLGTDIHTGLPIFFDMFNRNPTRPSSNLAIIASTGGGKSFTLKKMIINEFHRGNKVFIFDAEGEYEKLVEKNGGEYINLYSAEDGIINPLQVRFIESDEKGAVKESSSSDNLDCILAKHLSILETFFKCVFEDISEKEIVVLLDMIEKLYQKFGITKNTDISVLKRLKATDYPIFSDLIKYLEEYRAMTISEEKKKIINELQIFLERFEVGTDSVLFNSYTTVNLESDLIAFNVKDLLYSKNKRIITTQLFNLLTYLNNIIVNNKMMNDSYESQKKISIVVDEFHLYLKNTDSEVLLTFEQIARRIRKYHGAFIPATQSIHDFIGDDDSVRSATAIFNNCQYQLVGTLKEDDLQTYIKLFYQNPLTDTQQEFLSKSKQGEFLLTVTNKVRLRVAIMATLEERELMGETI